MTISSMTAFARAEGHGEGFSWVWELKSVNGKSLDLRFRLPPGFDALEIPLRASLARRLRRGAITIVLQMTRAAAGGGLRLNRAALDQVLALMRELEGTVDAAPPRLDGILALRGVLEAGEELELPAREALDADLLASCETALDKLVAMRESEGARLATLLVARVDEIAALVAAAENAAAAQPAQIKARLVALVGELAAAANLPEERLAQEVALLIAKADVREELDRLAAHVAAAREHLAEGGAIGRKLDFLCQEFHREANTLCAKSADLALTRIGLALKAAIEQLREQVQNIE
jgi:uncharacterized protein (TIGR00255 family)